MHVLSSSVDSSPTWGGLLADASADLRRLARDLRTAGPATRRAAVEALHAYAQLQAATAELWRLLWADVDKIPSAAKGLAALLAATPVDAPAAHPLPATSSATSCLRTTAVTVRAAGDLLATHTGPDGPRTPEGELLQDPDAVLAGAGLLADLLAEAARCAVALAGYARAHLVAARQVTRILGDPAALDLAARRFRDAAPTPAALAELGLAHPPLRVTPAPAQLADRLQRVRRYAWRLARAPRVSATTLADLAACAVDLNGYAARAGWCTSAAPAWRTLRRALAELRTTTPPSAAVRSEVVLVRQLLTGPLDPAHARPVVTAAVSGLPDLARWSATAFARLDEDRIYLHASALLGDEVTDHPDRVVAKLAGRLVVAPPARLADVTAAYGWAAAARIPTAAA